MRSFLRSLRAPSFWVTFALAIAACTEPPHRPADGLRLTEVVVDGSPYDWIEVVNAGDVPLHLVDFVYADALGDLDRARPFPDLRLAPGQRHLQPVDRARSGFALDGDDELWLYRVEDGALVDGVDWQHGDVPAGGALTRLDDTGDFVAAPVATPEQVTRGI